MTLGIKLKAIIPKADFRWEDYDKAITSLISQKTRPEVKRLFEQTVSGWGHKPVFRGTIKRARGKYIRLWTQPTGPNKAQWHLVSRGAKPHPIPAKSGGYMSFQSGYSPATRVGSIRSQSKQRFGAWHQRTLIPRHPGFEGREFEEQIADIYYPTFKKDVNFAIRKTLRNSFV